VSLHQFVFWLSTAFVMELGFFNAALHHGTEGVAHIAMDAVHSGSTLIIRVMTCIL